MTQQNIDFGSGAENDGEFIATAFQKIQANFEEMYARTEVADDTFVSILTFGADPTGATDSTAAFIDAASTGRKIYIPSGTFLVDGLILPVGTILAGDNRETSTIIAQGNPAITFTGDTTHMHSGLRDLTIKRRGTTGTCVWFDLEFNASFIEHSSEVSNCNFYPETQGTDEATKWLYISETRSSVVTNCYFDGSFDHTSDPSGQTQSVGIYVDGVGYGIFISDCEFRNLYTNVTFGEDTEGFYISSCEMVGAYDGIVCNNVDVTVGGWIDSVHINAIHRGIKWNKRNDVRITNTSIFSASSIFFDPSDFAAIELTDCFGVNIANCECVFGESTVAYDVTGIKASGCDYINVSNMFMHEFGQNAGACFYFTDVDNVNIVNFNMLACDNPMTADSSSSNVYVTNWQRVSGTWAGWANIPARNDFRIDAEQEFRRFFAGTAAAPSISGQGSTTTGLFWPTTDHLGFTRAGSEVARFGTNGNFWIGTTAGSSARRLCVNESNASNNTVTRVGRFTHVTSGTPGVGIGVGLEFEVETSNGNNEQGVAIDAIATDVTAGSEDFDLVVSLMAGGATASEVARFLSTGEMRIGLMGSNALSVATKAYVDQSFAANDAMVYKGNIDCSANPNYPAADAGHTYRVSVAGKIGGGSGPNVEINDLLICRVDSTSAGTHASVGANWTITQTNIDGAVTGPASATSGNVATYNGTTGKIIQDGGKALPSGAIVGTSDAQTLTNKVIGVSQLSGQVAIANGGTGAASASAACAALGTWHVLGCSAVAVPNTGSTTENVLATIPIPAGAMGPNGLLRIRSLWSMTNSANSKTPRARLNGVSGTAYMAVVLTSVATWTSEITIANRNSASSQVGNAAATSAVYGGTGVAVTTGSIDTASAVDLVLTGQLANAGETITLESYVVEVLYGG